jgi:hypothetical protein|tara:strand:+ start:347 stop:490 length:144 start_codon:yes stop_codon:yes gene_type:complete
MKTLEDVNTIDELKEFVKDADLTEEEFIDLANYIMDKNSSSDSSTIK